MANQSPEYTKLLANARAAVAAKANEILKRNASKPTSALQAQVAAQFGNQQKQLDRILLEGILQKLKMDKKHPELPPITESKNREFVEEHLNLLHDPTELAGTGINYNTANWKHQLKTDLPILKEMILRLRHEYNSGQPNTRPDDVKIEEKVFMLGRLQFLKPELKELKQKMYDITNELFDARLEQNPNMAKLQLLEEKREAAKQAYLHLKGLYEFGSAYSVDQLGNKKAKTRKARKQRKMSLKKRS